MSNATITMPFNEFEAMRSREKFWQDHFNALFRIVKKYSKQDDNGVWQVGEDDVVSLADELEKYMNDVMIKSGVDNG